MVNYFEGFNLISFVELECDCWQNEQWLKHIRLEDGEVLNS